MTLKIQNFLLASMQNVVGILSGQINLILRSHLAMNRVKSLKASGPSYYSLLGPRSGVLC